MAQTKLVKCTINGEYTETMVDVRASLTDMLRNDFRLTSVKKGCEVGECGACNVIIDGECFNSCIYLAVWADGKNIRTLESLLGPNGELSDIQQAFIDEAAVLVGMLASSVIYWAGEAIFLHVNPFASLQGASFVPPFHDMAATTLFKFDFTDFFRIGWFTAITLVITFCMIDMFDTIGTLVGTASRAGMTDKDGNMPNMKEALTSDAIGTVAGACCGTSTVTTFVESASGVEAGGRTGLTALTTAVMFLACIFIAPIAAIIPAAATSSALIYVGILMLQGLKNVDFNDLDQIVPVFIMLIAMPISGSIGHGIGLAMISYTIIKVFSGKAKDVSVLTYVIAALFIVKFFAVV